MYRALLLSYGQDQVLAVVRFLLNSKLRYEPILQAQALKSKSVWCGLVYSQIATTRESDHDEADVIRSRTINHVKQNASNRSDVDGEWQTYGKKK